MRAAGGAAADLLLCVTPFERPDPGLVVAVLRGGATGILDAGRDPARARAALDVLERRSPCPYGVRIADGAPIAPSDLPPGVDTVLIASLERPGRPPAAAGDAVAAVTAWGAGRRVLVEVRTLAEARAALAAGAAGLVARGSEGGGRVAEETAFVLLQRLRQWSDVPLWAAGGIGVHSAAAAVAGGATGVLLDAQLALTRESTLPEPVRAAVASIDGSETTVAGGHRVYVRPDLPAARLPSKIDPAEVAGRLGGDDLQSQLLPAGQEAAFARPLSARWPTAGALVHGLRTQIGAHLRDAARHDPLAPGAPLAAAHGLRYPIAQGPMTRVSDRAEFAEAVAKAGGLPFLALSLSSGAEARALLEETSARLAGLPWGAGILGFVPPEVREAQLEAIRAVRPPVVLVAGGRPSQARPLEEAGIATYLHVPSPGLLGRFLRDGARRFVFEGRECGGHVGPRSSFALWDAQVETILASGLASEVSVLFAGGVHDARSAAMVAALAAPLAAQGGRVGVLMGTAYLFTEEAVAAGAILPGFQHAALDCTDTVLLETAPGHATRCAATGYVRAFEAERARLEREGVDPKEMWAALEVLNLGRLRIASKGLARQGEQLVRLGADEQASEGMFMLGQVAALRREATTIGELHEEVSAGSSAVLAPWKGVVRMPSPERPEDADVAIIGMACVFPEAPDAETYWANVVAGHDAVREVPRERWDADLYYDPAAVTDGAGRKTPSRWGGFLPQVPFDALAYGIPPRSLAAIEPVQLLSLDVAARALADAGYGPDGRELDRGRVSVVFGAEAGTDLASAYGFRALAPQYLGGLGERLDGLLPELTEDSFPGLLTNVIAGRIANRLDLGGVNFTVDAACASSLAAVDVAIKELRSGSSEMVLCGGADLHNGVNAYLLFAAVHALSPKGRCASFDAAADGIALGEGVACVVLKRLEHARRDGDRVYAVLRSVAGSSDGRSLGLTAPRPEGQRRALLRAYEGAQTSPAQVGLVEAHGTGTVVGDRTELAVLTELFEEAGAGRQGCALGSVKSQIGHTKCAAGLAGLIKVARAVYHGVLPPTIHVETPNPGYDADGSPFVFHTAARPWVGEERVAGVSAFGFGGTNFHAVVAGDGEAATPRHGLDRWPAELFLFRGATPAAARETVELVARQLAAGASAAPALRDLAAAAGAAGEGPVQLALVARDRGDLAPKLAEAAELLRAAGAPESEGRAERAGRTGVFPADRSLAGAGGAPEVAFLFPGQGSQRPGMLAGLFVAFPELRRQLEAAPDVAAKMLPPAAFGPDGARRQEDELTDTRVAQPALGIADLAAARLLASVGVVPAAAGGHSYGELAALAAAGAIPEDELVGLSRARAEVILAAAGEDPGAMAALAAPADEVRGILEPDAGVVIANDNAPRQVVLSGPTGALEEAVAALAEAGLPARRIKVACAFHSPVVAGAGAAFRDRLAGVELAAPRFPVWSNTTGAPYGREPEAVRDTLARQLEEPVRFREQVEAMHAAGARVFVEVGPGDVLTGLVGRILADEPHRAVAVASRTAGVPDLEAFLLALAELAALGVPVDPAPLFEGRARPLDLRAPPPAPAGWLVNGHLVRTAAGEVVPGALRPVEPPAPGAAPAGVAPAWSTTETVVSHADSGAPAASDARAAAVAEYLRSLRETVAAGRDVMLAFLGAPAPAATAPAAPVVATAAALPYEPARLNRSAPHAPEPVVATAAPTSGPPPAPTGAALHELVTGIVSERTGYPIEMLDSKLDLEADLSIDSIKRLEIVSELAERLGLDAGGGAVDDAVMEELVQLKTLEGVVGWLEAALAAPAAAEAPQADAHPLAAAPAFAGNGTSPGHAPAAHAHGHAVGDAHHGHPEATDLPGASLRFVPATVELDPPRPAEDAFAGRSVAITDDGAGLAPVVRDRLLAAGATVRLLEPGGPLGDVEVLVHLAPLAPGAGNRALALFARAQEALRAGATKILAATWAVTPEHAAGETAVEAARQGSLRFAGMGGALKTLARELPDVLVRLVELDPAAPLDELAGLVLAELADPGAPVEVSWAGGVRSSTAVAEDAWAPVPDPTVPVVEPGAVVLLTGGARGITGRVAVALARRWRCHLVLAGRSPEPPADEPPLLAAASGPVEVRRALAAAGFGAPAEIDAETRRLLAAREIRATLAAVRAAGGTVEYRSFDSRDAASARDLVEQVYRDHGRLDGIVHGAGVLEDARLLDKTAASFARVYATKVEGALAMVDALRPGVRFVVFFASVSGIFGNRGQVDYAAANDALAHLARWLDRRLDARVVAVDWGPWAGSGMVSAELEREFGRRGVGLLDEDDAVERLLDELRSDAREPEVVVMRARPERFGGQVLAGPAGGPRRATRPARLALVVDG